MKKIVITTGLISGAIVSVIMGIGMAIYASNPSLEGSTSMVIGYASQILALSIIFIAVKNYRDKYSGGQISFGRALSIGLLISLIATAIYVIAWAIEYNTMYPHFMEQYSDHMLQKIKSSGATQAAIDAQVAQMKWYKDNYHNPLFFIFFTAVEIFPTGLLISLICAMILKRKKKAGAAA